MSGAIQQVKASHIGATALNKENNFFLHQTLLSGLSAGISKGAFGMRPKDLTADEWAQRIRKFWNSIRDFFENWLNHLHQKIEDIRYEIDEEIEQIESQIEQLSELQPAEAHEDTLQRLKEDKDTFVAHRETLDEIAEESLYTTPASAPRTQSRFEAFQKSYTAFKQKFDSYSTSSSFNAANDEYWDTHSRPQHYTHEHTRSVELELDIGSPSGNTSGNTDDETKKSSKELQEALARMRTGKDSDPNAPNDLQSPPPAPKAA